MQIPKGGFMHHHHHSGKNLGLAAGLVWGAAMFVLTILCMFTGYPAIFLAIIESLYIGYSVSFIGAIIGFIYGFLDAFIGVWVFMWVYHKLCKRSECCDKSECCK